MIAPFLEIYKYNVVVVGIYTYDKYHDTTNVYFSKYFIYNINLYV